MKSKKAGAGLIIGITLGLLMLISAVVVLAILNNKGYFASQQEPVSLPTLNLYLKSTDKDSTSQIEANYVVEYNGTTISKGKTNTDGWTEIQVPTSETIDVSCWNEDHYVAKISKTFSSEDISINKSTLSCDAPKIGKLIVSNIGDLSQLENQIHLNISTSDYFYHPLILVSWSAGINSVSLNNQNVRCESGAWINWTSYDPLTLSYTYLPSGYYSCGDQTEQCEAVSGSFCSVKKMDVPAKYSNKVDSVFYVGGTIIKSSKDITFTVRTGEVKNELDHITFTILDMDRRQDSRGNWNWATTDSNGIDIGSKTIEYTINYKTPTT